MHKYLWAAEIEHIEKCKTFKYANMLLSPKDRDHLEAYFQIGGLIIEAADNGVGELAGCPLLCFDVKNPEAFQDSELRLSLTE